MLEMPPRKLKALSKTQLKYIAHKPMNILAKKLHKYQDTLLILNSRAKEEVWWVLLGLNLFSIFLELDLWDLCLKWLNAYMLIIDCIPLIAIVLADEMSSDRPPEV